MNRGEELKPGFKKTILTAIKGKRSVTGGHLHGQHSGTESESVYNPGHARAVL